MFPGEGLRGNTLNWAVTAASCQAFLLLGYDQGVMSGLIGADNVFGRQFGHPDANMQGIMASIYDIGCAVGCLVAFFAGHRIGRKKMILVGGAIMIIGTILLGSSYTRAQFLVGRIVTGLGNGLNSSTVPTYQSEMAKPNVRGRLLSAQGTVTIFGLCIAFWMDYGLSFVSSSAQWRFPISFQAFFAVLLVLQMLPLPESPRWLCEQGRVNEATQVLARLQAAQPADENTPEVVMLRMQIETAIELEGAGGPFRLKELLKGGDVQNLRRMLLAGWLMVMQQFTGSNMLNYYAPVVYENTMGLSRNLSLILGGCASLTYFVGSIIPLWSMDRFGRRLALMVSFSGLSICFILVSILLSIGNQSCAYGATAMLFVFQLFQGIGSLPVPWRANRLLYHLCFSQIMSRFYPAEISTTRIRAHVQAFTGFSNWMCVFIVVQITPIVIQNIAWRTFVIFACCCCFWVPIVYFFYPETCGLELEDADHLFERGGITGGVWETRGHPIQPGFHRRQILEAMEMETKRGVAEEVQEA